MSVYVDQASHRYGRMIMCHMLADTPEELMAMADAIGVARRHYQLTSFPHFDICKAKRAAAVKLGAIELDRRGVYQLMKRLKPIIKENPEPWRAAGQRNQTDDQRAMKGTER